MKPERETWEQESGLTEEEWTLLGKVKWNNTFAPTEEEWKRHEDWRIKSLVKIKENNPSLFSEIISKAMNKSKVSTKERISHWDYEAEKELSRVLKKYGMEDRYFRIGLGDSWNYANICMWFKDAGKLLKRAPKIKEFKYSSGILSFDTDEEKRMFMQLHYRIPSKYTKYFKSYIQAYRMALEFYDIGKKNKFGYTCLAKDGHKCNSLVEAKIDDFLSDNKISHEKEPPYPNSTWRADFKVNDIYIEYFGLLGNVHYDKKTEAKIQFAEKNNIKLIAIYPNDIETNVWKQKLSRLK
ncbi:MAG: hypothetical protein ACOCUV_01680 [bacterium]